VKAIVATQPGGPEVLSLVDRPDPVPGPDELLVRVHAAGLNRADLMQRQGNYPPPPDADDVLGLEVAGVVAEVGEADGAAAGAGFAVGDRVCAVVSSGGYAEFVVVPAAHALPVPDDFDWIGAAAVPEAFTTAWDNVFTRAGLRSGETLLVHGGSSGVGTAAVQLARRAGVRIAVTASSEKKLGVCAELGAECLIDYTRDDFVEEVRRFTDGRGADVILDMVGAAYLERNLEALALEGRLTVIGLQKGRSATLDMGRMLSRRLHLMGATLRARTREEKGVVAQQVRAHVWPGFTDGSLRPVVHAVYDWADVAQAHRDMEAGGHIGKLILRVR
jgi:putative PIG3 family NAD(P)H quinone oxidoreductase